MKNSDLKKSITALVKVFTRKQGRPMVQINHSLPYLSIQAHDKPGESNYSGKEFFAQGEYAANLIAEITEISNKTNLPLSTCAIWYLEGAGALDN